MTYDTILGVNIGYSYTKTSEKGITKEGVLFPSKATQDKLILSGDCNKLSYNNQDWIVGEGEGTVELNKINTSLTKVLLLSAIALSTQDTFVKVVTGLPIDQFQTEQYDQLKNLLKSIDTDIKFNGKFRHIKITDAEVYPEGASPLYYYEIQGEAILIDWGSRTTNICLFEIVDGKRKLTKSNTLYQGILNLYDSIIESINKKFTLALKSNQAQNILKNGLYVFGVKQDLSFIKSIIQSFIEPIITTIKINYPYKTTKTYQHGGGAYLLGEIFKTQFPNTEILPDAQFCNAKGFKRIGEYKWARA